MAEQHDYSAYAGMGHNAQGVKNEIVDLAHKQLAQERKIEKLEVQLKEAKEELRVIAEQNLPEKMNELGIAEFTTPDGLKIQIKDVVNANVSEERRDTANKWLDDNGYGNLLKSEVITAFGRDQLEEAKVFAEKAALETGNPTIFKRSVHAQTLKAFVREHLASGKDIPLDLFGINRFQQAKITLKNL